jgi:hypothetical protein
MHAFSVAFVSFLAILPRSCMRSYQRLYLDDLNSIHLTAVLSTPIPVWSSTVVNEPAVNDEASQARVTAYREADARGRSIHSHRGERFAHTFASSAKEMVSKMVTVINSDKPEHEQIVNDAFGPKADRKKIKATIHKLDTQQVQIESTDVAIFKSKDRKKADSIVAKTPVVRPDRIIGVDTGPIKLGAPFFGKFSAIFTISPVLNVLNVSIAGDSTEKDFRAGTLIHEATHQQSHTGDLINKHDKIIGAFEDQRKDINGETQHVGCTFAPFRFQLSVHDFA